MFKRESIFVTNICKYKDTIFCNDENIAYSLAKQSLSPFRSNSFAAWKLGGATIANREYFNVNHIFWGELTKDQVKEFNQPQNLRLKSIRTEGEIALRINPNLDQRSLLSLDYLKNIELFDSFCFCFEMPDCSIDNLNGNIYALLSDRCASGALILGQWIDIKEFDIEHNYCLSILEQKTKNILARGYIFDLVENPFILARNFIKRAIDLGFKINSGDIVSTGGVTPCINLSDQEIYSLYVNDLSVLSIQPYKVNNDSYNIR